MLNEAQTPEDLEAVRQLLAESKKLAGTGETPPTAPPPVGRWVVATQAEVAAFFGMSIQSIWGWRSLANDPMPGQEGQWDIQQITAWRCEKIRVAAGTVKSAEILDLERRDLQAGVEKKELVLLNEQGKLVSRDAVKAQLAAILTDARNQIEAIPSELGPSIPHDLRSELTHQITQRVALILRKMSQRSEE